MLPKLRNTTFFPSWVDDFFTSTPWPDIESRVGATMPAVNIKEDENQYSIDVAAPGMEKKNFKLELINNVLIISAEKREEKEEKQSKFSRKEFNYTSFRRSFTLPQTVKEEGIKATYENGVLRIGIPKIEEAKSSQTKQITII